MFSNIFSSPILTKESLRRNNFSPEEFFVSDTVYRINHDANPDNDFQNYPDPKDELSVLPCLMSTADMMQEIRELLGKSIKINSAYRCPTLNTMVGSNSRSQHLQGLACDFICPSFGTAEKIVKFLHSKGFKVDQCFNEGSWVHISRLLHADAKNRMMYGYYLPDKTGKRRCKPL